MVAGTTLQASQQHGAGLPLTSQVKLSVQNLSVKYGEKQVLKNLTVKIRKNEIFGIIGPVNSGKSSFVKSINRMDSFKEDMHVKGKIYFDGIDVHSIRNEYALRNLIGVVSPLPVGLPMSVYDNVAFAPRLKGIRDKRTLDEIVEYSLKKAALWDEIKDRLKALGSLLSGGQQQRLTIARALSQDPELLILDEFSIAIDPVTTSKIEDAIRKLKKEITIILISNIPQQSKRLADRTAFFLEGECIEIGETHELFSGYTKDQRTQDYISGRFG